MGLYVKDLCKRPTPTYDKCSGVSFLETTVQSRQKGDGCGEGIKPPNSKCRRTVSRPRTIPLLRFLESVSRGVTLLLQLSVGYVKLSPFEGPFSLPTRIRGPERQEEVRTLITVVKKDPVL